MYDPKEWVELYIDKKLTTRGIGLLYSIAPSTVWRYLKKLGVRMRTESDYIKLNGPRINSGGFQLGHKTLTAVRAKISHTLKARGIQPSSEAIAKGAERRRKYIVTPELAGEIKRLYTDEQLTIYQIAKSKELSSTCVYRVLLRQGVEFRSRSERNRALWANPEWKQRQVALARQGEFKRPTKPEQQLIDIITKNNLPYRYTGDGSFIIGGLNPDFVNVNGRKIAIELFGDYWHSKKADSYIDTEEGRAIRFKEYGWELVVIWETEINTLPEETIVAKLRTEGGRQYASIAT